MSKKRKKTSGKVRKSRNNETAREARQAFKDGNYDKAIITLNTSKAKKLLPDDRRTVALAEAYFRRGMRYRERHPSDALRDLSRAADLRPKDALYNYHIGLLHHQLGNFSEAVVAYRRVLAHNPDFERAALPLLMALQADGASTADLEAEDAWSTLDDEQRALLMGDVPDEMLGLPAGLAAMQRGDIEEAQAQIAEVLKGKRTPDGHKAIAHDYLGRIAARSDDLKEAMIHWQKAYRLGRRAAVFMDNMALLHVLQAEANIEAGDNRAAFEQGEQAATYGLDHPRLPDIRGYTALVLGYEAAQDGNWQLALDYWRDATASGATARAMAANLGLAYEEIEDYGRAADAWRDFAKRRSKKPGSEDYLTPEQVGRLWSRVSRLYTQAGEGGEAVDTLKIALKHDPDNIEMNLQLTRRLAEVGSTDAAHNQVERVLQMDPNNIEALVLRAELWEVAPPRGTYAWGGVFGIEQWRDVLDAGDEAYASLAKQRLEDLYFSQVRYMRSFTPDRARQIALQVLDEFPDFNIVRAVLIQILYYLQEDREDVWEQIDKLDLTDEEALHYLIDIMHIYGADEDAEKILQRAEAQQKLPGRFYEGVGHCAVDREQIDIANNYFRQAIDRIEDDEARKHIRVDMAQHYYSTDMTDQAKKLLNEVLDEDARFGPAHLGMAAMINAEEGSKTRIKRHLRKARSWAKQHNDEDLLYQVEDLLYIVDNPMPLGGLDPSTLPPDLQRLVEGMSPEQLASLLGGMIDDVDEDEFY